MCQCVQLECVRVRHVMTWEAIMVKGFLNRDWCLLDYRFCFKPFFLVLIFGIWHSCIEWYDPSDDEPWKTLFDMQVSLQNFKKKCVGYNPNQDWSVGHLGVFNNRNTGHCWGPVCHFSVLGIECEMPVFIEYNT